MCKRTKSKNTLTKDDMGFLKYTLILYRGGHFLNLICIKFIYFQSYPLFLPIVITSQQQQSDLPYRYVATLNHIPIQSESESNELDYITACAAGVIDETNEDSDCEIETSPTVEEKGKVTTNPMLDNGHKVHQVDQILSEFSDLLTTVPVSPDISVSDLLTNVPVSQGISVSDLLTNVPVSQGISVSDLLTNVPVSHDISVSDLLTNVPVSQSISVSDLLTNVPVSHDISVSDLLTTVPVSQDISVLDLLTTVPVSHDILVLDLLTNVPVSHDISVSDLLTIVPVSQDISEPDEWEPFRFMLALVAGFLGTTRIFRNRLYYKVISPYEFLTL